MVKTEMARGPLNFAEIRNPFGFLQTNPQADAWWVGLYSLHPTAHTQLPLSDV